MIASSTRKGIGRSKKALVDADKAAHEPRLRYCIAFLAILVFVFFREILLGQAWLWEDMVYYSYPVRSFAATSMAMGQMPLWNPYTFNGMPFLADIQTAVFYLPMTALALFVHHGTLNFYWLEVVVILHYLLAGLSMFFLSGSFGLRRIPSMLAGIAYMFSGFMITHAIHQQIITLVAWYPLTLLLFKRSLTDRSWKWVFFCSLVLGHSTLAGYPQLSLYLYAFLFAFFIFELLKMHGGTGLLSRPAMLTTAKAGCIIILSLSVAMIQLLPTFELADLSQRAQITYEKSTEGSLAWSQFLTLLYPKLFGASGAGGYSYWGPGPYWHYWETCIYLGAIPLFLVLLSVSLVRKNPYVLFLWGVVLFSASFALGDHFVLHKLFFDFVPGFSKFRNPARIGILLSLASSLLAAFSLHHILYQPLKPKEKSTLRNLTLSVMGLALMIWLLVFSGSLSDTLAYLRNQQSLLWVTKQVHLSLFVLFVSGISIVWVLARPGYSLLQGYVPLVILFLDLLSFGGSQNNAALNPADYFGRPKAIVQFLRQQAQSEIFRVNTRNADGMIMDRNQGMIDRIFTMEGYTPLVLQRAYAPYRDARETFDLLNVRYSTVTDTQARRLTLVENPSHFPRAFMLFGIHIANSEEELTAYLKSPAFDHHVDAVLEKDPGVRFPPSPSPPKWTTSIPVYENRRSTVDVTTERDGMLVLSEIFYPGWRAFIDGSTTEIFRTDYNLRGIIMPRGAHTVDFRFEPNSYLTGRFVSISAVLVCLVGVVVSGIKQKNAKKE